MSQDLKARLVALGLDACAATLDDIVATATKKRWGIVDALTHIADIEEKDRARRGLDRRMKRSKLEQFKPMVDFDWNWPTKIDRGLVESIVRADFVDAKRNVVLVAQGGLGKTMIAQNIADAAIRAGHTVLFVSAAQLLLDLGSQESASALERRLRHYAKVSLLILDEIGFLGFDNLFPSAVCATALVERVIHHADVVTIEGESYRLRESETDAKARRAARKPPK